MEGEEGVEILGLGARLFFLLSVFKGLLPHTLLEKFLSSCTFRSSHLALCFVGSLILFTSDANLEKNQRVQKRKKKKKKNKNPKLLDTKVKSTNCYHVTT